MIFMVKWTNRRIPASSLRTGMRLFQGEGQGFVINPGSECGQQVSSKQAVNRGKGSLRLAVLQGGEIDQGDGFAPRLQARVDLLR